MDKCKEPISLRNGRLFNSVLCHSGPMHRSTRMKMSQDALLDAFMLLYDECNKDSLRKDPNIANFINKYRTLLTEIKSLRVNIDDFELMNTIGQGHFGEVRVVKEKQTNDIYAMKIIKKYDMTGKISSALFEEEHDIMCTATSNWLTTLQYSFQDDENLYFIMDYHSGGDLLCLMDRHEGILSPDLARFYLAETALAIKALHQMGYVHRDIKPDNILLDCCGHVKLVDFGSAAKLSSSGLVTQTMPVGTPEYIAPEILVTWNNGNDNKAKKQYYGCECDYWSLGILAYEMVVGRTPFSGSQIKATYFNIMNYKKKIEYPNDRDIPDSLKDFIAKLLNDPSLRLKHDGIVKHPFFREINWNNIRNEVPPYVPSSTLPNDLSNCIEVQKRKAAPRLEMKTSKKDFSGKHLPFIGFTYSHGPDASDKKLNDSGGGNNEKKNPALETLLSVTKKENKNLISKLYEAQFEKNDEFDNLRKKFEEKKRLLEICEADRNKLQRDVAKMQKENNNIQRILELERKDREETESNALKLITENKIKIERNFNNRIKELNAQIEEANDKLTDSHTVNNELTSNLDRARTELASANKEIEQLKILETEFKNKLAEAREFKRKSVVGFESRWEKIVSENQMQVGVLQKKLDDEIALKSQIEEKLLNTELTRSKLESELKLQIKEYEEKTKKLESKISAQQSEIQSLQLELADKPDVVLLIKRLETEEAECKKLRSKIIAIEQELKCSADSLKDREIAIVAQEETVQSLEKELREASDEKMRLQKKLQKTKEIDEENRQKLSNLEVVVDRLEQGVIKLETENHKLKQQVIAHAQPITSEAEARYQEKITILEDQVAKFENQVEKLRESLFLEKESLKSTQSALWKAEKELADCKIDIRIGKRECKTAEDLVKRLQDESRILNTKLTEIDEKYQKIIAEKEEKLNRAAGEKESVLTELSQKVSEINNLKKQLEEYKDMADKETKLRKDHDEIVKRCKLLENQLEILQAEKEQMKESLQFLHSEKCQTESLIEELKQKISGLELNNTVLKDMGAMLDEQLEDYDKFTTNQTKKIESLTNEKISMEKEIEKIQCELRNCRKNLNEEKSLKLRVEQKVAILESELANKDDAISKLQSDLCSCKEHSENLTDELADYDKRISAYEMEIREGKQLYEALDGECQWLKKEASNYLTNLYSLKESNYKLTQDLEEEHQMVEALQERICELQTVITDLESFHKQREVKDEATKQQQNKLITFLQEKLNDTKKKKSLTDVLFGMRSKENVIPSISPLPYKSTSNNLIKNKISSKKISDSPTSKLAISELVKSPKSQSYFQRQDSVQQRMHHNIPHRFANQNKVHSEICGVCQNEIKRSQCSTCTVCKIHVHPKCAALAPKTCGLPKGLIKHYAKSVAKVNSSENLETFENHAKNVTLNEGWMKLLNFNKTRWDKKYVRLEENKLLLYEEKPAEISCVPSAIIKLRQSGRRVIIGEITSAEEIPNTPNINSVIKVAIFTDTACWPHEVHYLMMPSGAEKSKWLVALNNVICGSPLLDGSDGLKYKGTIIRTFSAHSSLDLNCSVQINESLILVGAQEGLFSLKIGETEKEPVKIEGPSAVHDIVLASQIGLAIMIAEKDRRLVSCDYRALISNAEAASCVNPKVTLKPVESQLESESCLLFSLSPSINGTFYLLASTSNKLFILKWCLRNSRFEMAKVLDTLHPCNCVLYTKRSVIVGCDKFFEIQLDDFAAQEFLDPSVKSLAFWRIGSFPMRIFEVSGNEYLLCFSEFGVFVNGSGGKTQCDLKWKKVPCDFAYSKPYLYVIHASSVEIIRVPFLDAKASNDSICTSSTATITDSVHVNFNCPRYLGSNKTEGSIYIRTNSSLSSPSDVNLVLLEGRKFYQDDLGSCGSLNTISDDNGRNNRNEADEFSFTSSLVNSLENVGSSTPKNSESEESCTTYTISDGGESNACNRKMVTFVQP